jgi:IS30 family transposase
MSRCYTQITLADRRRLHHMVAAKVPVNEMARQLGRHRSTIYREIRRNTFRDRELPDYDGYYSTVANDTAKDRRRRLRKLRRHPTLRTEIINQLEARWSPEQIAGRLLLDGLSRIRVCKETIYRFIYSKEDYGLGLYQYLPDARRKRRPSLPALQKARHFAVGAGRESPECLVRARRKQRAYVLRRDPRSAVDKGDNWSGRLRLQHPLSVAIAEGCFVQGVLAPRWAFLDHGH